MKEVCILIEQKMITYSSCLIRSIYSIHHVLSTWTTWLWL